MTEANMFLEKQKLLKSISKWREFFKDYLRLNPQNEEIKSAMNVTNLHFNRAHVQSTKHINLEVNDLDQEDQPKLMLNTQSGMFSNFLDKRQEAKYK